MSTPYAVRQIISVTAPILSQLNVGRVRQRITGNLQQDKRWALGVGRLAKGVGTEYRCEQECRKQGNKEMPIDESFLTALQWAEAVSHESITYVPNIERMNSTKHRGSVKIALVYTLCSIAASFSFVGMQFRQAQLDAQLLTAIRGNDLLGVKRALTEGANPNAAEYVHQPLQFITSARTFRFVFNVEPPKSTAVGLAAAWLGSYRDDMDFAKSSRNKDVQDNREIVSCLLRAGADPNRQDVYGATPILIAVGDGNREAARLLIRHHARLDVTGSAFRCSLAQWIMEPAWEFPSPCHIMRCELRNIIEEERKAEATQHGPASHHDGTK
jgi:hypothetical protein